MARKARIKSSTGIYHVLVRAISDLSLFTDEEDTQYYIDILNDLQQQGRCEVYAYALFPTHVHLLIREGCNDTASGLRCEQSSTMQAEPYDNSHRSELALASRDRQGVPTGCEAQTHRSEANRNEVYRSETHRSASESSSLTEPIGSIMKRLASAYSYFFNVKYEHYGPIYLDRFKSNPVESRDYFLKVLDHIGSQQTETKNTCHHIPSGLASAKPNDTASGLRCEHSSTIQAQPYDNSHRNEEHRSKANRSKANRSASASSSFPPLLEFRERSKRITDSRLMAFLQQNYSFTNIGEFLQRPEEDIKATIKAAKKIGGSIRQIVRLTGTPYQAVSQVK